MAHLGPFVRVGRPDLIGTRPFADPPRIVVLLRVRPSLLRSAHLDWRSHAMMPISSSSLLGIRASHRPDGESLPIRRRVSRLQGIRTA